MTEFRGGTLRDRNQGTLRDHENNTASLLREIDIDRRSTLKDARYGTTSTYMSEHQSGTVFIRVSVPELKVQKCLQFELDETVWEAKQRILTIFAKDLKDALNYGIYMPPMNGRAGKFLDEERLLREYPLHGPIGFVEFKYKRRVYKVIHLNPRKLKQLHNKANFRQFIEHVKNGNLSKINKLTNKGLDPNFHDSSGETPLSYAVCLPKDKCKEVIITLVSGGGHLDFRTRHGQTPMHKAILHGNQAAVQTLLDLGASTNYKDGKGLTPLYYSVLYGKNANCAELLLHERAVIGTRDEQGWYEIHQACKLGLVQHLEHLMFYGADLNVTNASGNTALHICAVNNNEQCARVLLFRGANKHILNYNNQTPQQVAIIAGNVSLAELIKNSDESQVVPFREMPTFSSRRPRLSMYGSTLSLMSRSRSDPKLNITSTIDDSNITSPPSSMRSLPQHFQMYSDSGSYSASRGSDSPRSMSISSNSSGPGLSRMNVTPNPSMHSPQHEMAKRHDFTTLQRRYTYAGNQLGGVISENLEESFHEELEIELESRQNSVNKFPLRKQSTGNISEESEEVKFILGAMSQDDQNMNRNSPEVFKFPDPEEVIKQRRNPVLQASGESDFLNASEILGKVYLQSSLLDRKFVCIEPYIPDHPSGLPLEVGDTVQVMSVSDTGFWEGVVNEKEGWFPPHHVQEVRLRNKAGSLGDLLAQESRENTLLYRNTLATLVRSENSDYGPRTVVLQRASEGYGFVLRGAKSQLKPSGELDFRPTAEFPALQYLDSVDPGSVSDRAGLKAGDFILEINGENVVRASHDRVVHLIRSTGDTLAMKVVTVKPASRSTDWFNHQDKSLTMPNRKKKAPAPPQRDPRTSLSMSRSEGESVSEEMAVMDKLDEAIQGKKEAEETKTASIRSRTAAKRVSCIDMDNIGVDGKLEKSKSKSTPDLLEGDNKARKSVIYATPTVPDKKSSDVKNVYAVPGVNTSSGSAVSNVPASPTGMQVRPKGPPPPPPEETGSPRRQAPKPPRSESGESSSSEVVTINTTKQSPYASVKVLTNKTDSPDSAYESSFRPGASAKLNDEPNEAVGYKPGHQRTPSAGAVLVRDSDKQNVSFAEDRVLDHAAGFLKKHPNAKLLITAEGKEKVKNRNSNVYEPEPDYDSDSGEEKPQSPVKMREPKKQSITVISVGEKKEEVHPHSKRYTIHSSIPSEEKQMSSYSLPSQGFVIPPRPDGPAPSPPRQTSQSPRHQKSAAPAPPSQNPNVMTVKAEVNVQSTRRQQEPEEAPPLPETPPPDFDNTPSPREAPPIAPPPPAAAPPPPPPPPPPAPSVDVIMRSKSVVKADYIAPVAVPTDAIAAAVAKRQERLQNEGLKMTEQKPKTPAPVSIKDTNQAAILAAVAKRREKLEQQSETSVIDDIESRLQKTKKLQAAKFQIAGSKSVKKDTDTNTNNSNATSQNKPNFTVQSKAKKIEQDKKDEPEKEEFTFKVKPVITGLTEIKPKFTPKPLSNANTDIKQTNVVKNAKPKTQESLKLKPTPLDKSTPVGIVKPSDNKNFDKTNKVDNKTLTNSEQLNNEKNVNGQSDFIALAEKRRQEWLQRKQKSSESKSSTPEKVPTKTIEIKSVVSKDKTPPVSTKPTGLVKVKPITNGDMTKNGDAGELTSVPPPPPGFRDGGNPENTVVQLEIIPPPANFSSDSGTDMSHQHSPAFSPDTASLVSSLSTLSSLSGDGRGNGYEDVIAPPPPGFDDGDTTVIPPPPEFGNDNGKTSKTFQEKPVDQWLCNDVLDWLDSLGMSQYKSSFQRNCVDGKKLVSLSRNNYIDLGVTQVGHRMNLERSIKKAAIKQNSVSNNVIASEHL